MFKISKKKNFEELILNFIEENPAGVNITDIAKGIDSSRNTAGKYVSLLESSGKIFSKKVGPINLYFTAERRFIPKRMIVAHYSGLLTGLNNLIDDMEKIKQLGYHVADSLPISGSKYPDKVLPYKNGNLPDLIEYFGGFFPNLDFIFDYMVDVEIDINKSDKTAIIQLKNIKFENYDNIDLHFYIVSGVIEKHLTRVAKMNIRCDVNKIDKNKELVEFSLKFL